jgi:excisionase family DNA binding protein
VREPTDFITADKLPELLTVEEARSRRFLGVGRTKMYDLVRTGAIPSVRLGKLIRIPTRRLISWMQVQDEARPSLEADGRADERTKGQRYER